jgi:hypothetical protein
MEESGIPKNNMPLMKTLINSSFVANKGVVLPGEGKKQSNGINYLEKRRNL